MQLEALSLIQAEGFFVGLSHGQHDRYTPRDMEYLFKEPGPKTAPLFLFADTQTGKVVHLWKDTYKGVGVYWLTKTQSVAGE